MSIKRNCEELCFDNCDIIKFSSYLFIIIGLFPFFVLMLWITFTDIHEAYTKLQAIPVLSIRAKWRQTRDSTISMFV